MADLISRQAVNDALDRTCNLVCQYSKKQRYAMCGACPLGSAFDAIAELPSDEKHGKWGLYEEPDGYYHTECSECGKWFDEDLYWEKTANFCPNCGARMDKED